MKTKTTLLSTFASLFIAYGSFAGNGKYDLGSHEFKSPNLQPNKSIASIQYTSSNKGITEGGFFLHYNPYVPSKKYGFLKAGTTIEVNPGTDSSYFYNQTDVEKYRKDLLDVGKFNIGHGLEFGNMFRLTDFDPMAIGLRVTWFDFGISGFKANSQYSQYKIKGISFDLRALKIGPYFTYALTDQMALDAFYQVVPTFIAGGLYGEYNGDEVGYAMFQYGLSHEIGLTYRFDILSIGVGYGMGNMRTLKKPFNNGSGTYYSLDGRAYVNTFRIMAGMKF